MSPPLTYLPAYLGLYAALVLAIACNAFLDIQYDIFGNEVLIWAAVYGYTLRVAWRQSGEVSEAGLQRQKVVAIVAVVASLLVFMPMWGLPRAAVYGLAALQAAMNCITTSRRKLHMGLLVSLVMVMFAASHYRADWTMLFYLVPYLAAVIFTLVAEQVSRRAQDLRREGLARSAAGGQGAAIAAATGAILLLGGLFYLATPQLTRPYLEWRYGQISSLGFIGGITVDPGAGSGGLSGEAASGKGDGSPGGNAQGAGTTPGQAYELAPWRGWPTLAQLREAAARPGMPAWQSAAIGKLAEVGEAIDAATAPLRQTVAELWNRLKEWLGEHRQEAVLAGLGLLAAALLVAGWLLLREARPLAWLRAHFEFLRLGLFAFHAPGNAGARQYYRAMERLLRLHDVERAPTANTVEYLALIAWRHEHLQPASAEITALFEKARYGAAAVNAGEVTRMRHAYRRLYSGIGTGQQQTA